MERILAPRLLPPRLVPPAIYHAPPLSTCPPPFTAVSSALALTATIMDERPAGTGAACGPAQFNLMALQLQEPHQAAAPEMGDRGEEAEGEAGGRGGESER